MTEGKITTSLENGILIISFYHPASNSFPSYLLQQLTATIQEANVDENVQIMVLKSEGTAAFCAGASFDELLQIKSLDDGKRFFSGFANVINAMRNCSKLIIGRIHGKAVGGGVGLAAACDLAFATSQSSIKLSEIAIGIGPFVIEPAVSKKMGANAFKTLSLHPTKWQEASWACQNGLFETVFETVADLDAHIKEFTAHLTAYNPEALSELKQLFWQNTQHWDTLLHERAAISGKLVLSDFTKNALQKFTE